MHRVTQPVGSHSIAVLSPDCCSSIRNLINNSASGYRCSLSILPQLCSGIQGDVDDVVMDGISKVFTQKDIQDDIVTNSKVGAGLEHDDNIPLRITLRLLDEVFDLADRNIWLRRQMIIVLRQIVKTMFGDTVNKKIVDYFASLTSVEAVAGYLNNFKVKLFCFQIMCL